MMPGILANVAPGLFLVVLLVAAHRGLRVYRARRRVALEQQRRAEWRECACPPSGDLVSARAGESAARAPHRRPRASVPTPVTPDRKTG